MSCYRPAENELERKGDGRIRGKAEERRNTVYALWHRVAIRGSRLLNDPGSLLVQRWLHVIPPKLRVVSTDSYSTNLSCLVPFSFLLVSTLLDRTRDRSAFSPTIQTTNYPRENLRLAEKILEFDEKVIG